MSGHVQRQVRRPAWSPPTPRCHSANLLIGHYAGRRPRRWPIYRALKRYAVNVGRGLWALNAELMRRIRG